MQLASRFGHVNQIRRDRPLTREELMQAFHAPHVQKAATDKNHHAPGFARIFCIVDFLS